jgi:hypothetical protein
LSNRIEKSESREEIFLMRGKLAKEYKLQSDFSEILRRAYEKGISDGTITIEKMIEDLKTELLKITAD